MESLPCLLFEWLGKKISSKEFSFENINNLTSGKDLKIFKGAFAENTKIKRAGL